MIEINGARFATQREVLILNRYLPQAYQRRENFVRQNTSLLLCESLFCDAHDARLALEKYYWEKLLEMCVAMARI